MKENGTILDHPTLQLQATPGLRLSKFVKEVPKPRVIMPMSLSGRA